MGPISKREITIKAKEVGFEKHSDSKIKAHDLLLSFFWMIGMVEISYSCWASCLKISTEKIVSKQAIFKRMNHCWVKLVKQLVTQSIQHHISSSKLIGSSFGFKNIYIQDSTTISLPDILKALFPGNISRGKQKAIAKINAVINLNTGLCCHLGITGFTTNEQKLSGSILDIAKAGDLVIRDMGYFVLSVFKKMDSENIYFISRLKYGIALFKDDQRIGLLRLLRNKSKIDLQVQCGQEKLPVRLIAVKLSQEQASEKIRKAKKDRDKRLNHTKEYYESLNYIFMITNIENSKCTANQITEIYRIRWQIEIMFKSWKSCLNIEGMIPSAKCRTERVESIIYMLLLFVLWFEKKIMARLNLENISIIKLTKEIVMNLHKYLMNDLCAADIEYLEKKCQYEKRDRVNASQRLSNIFSPFG